MAYIALTKKRFILHDFIAFSGRYIYPNSVDDEDKEYYDICAEQIDGSIRSFFQKMAIMLASIILGIGPMISTFTRENKITGTQLKFPYIEENSNAEFFGNFIIGCNIMGHGLLAYFSIEVGMDIVTDVVVISRKLLEYRLRKLYNRRKQKSCTDFEIISVLRNIVEHLQNFDGYDQL